MNYFYYFLFVFFCFVMRFSLFVVVLTEYGEFHLLDIGLLSFVERTTYDARHGRMP